MWIETIWSLKFPRQKEIFQKRNNEDLQIQEDLMPSKVFSPHLHIIHELVTESSSHTWLVGSSCFVLKVGLKFTMLAPAGPKLPIILLTQPPKLQRLQA